MYQTKHVHYKIIFKQDGKSETIEYKSDGIIDYNHKTHLSFETQDGTIDLSFDENEIILKHGESLLRFLYDKELWNEYKLPYGSVSLKTKLISFTASEKHIKMKYELYDQNGLISTAYVFITLITRHIQEEL